MYHIFKDVPIIDLGLVSLNSKFQPNSSSIGGDMGFRQNHEYVPTTYWAQAMLGFVFEMLSFQSQRVAMSIMPEVILQSVWT